ncbi:nucleoside triphosphate pyrophosphohydrolase [Rhodococcoides corynebacterioides]|uniref:nucleoside triphosphate pyrophosphohydrolase n=1 Tax=Rhodococcoides corynebacterioides TaxID=53972 RepID=UPI003AECE98C
MGKLVRDKIPALIRAEGREPDTRTLSDDDYEKALRDKLVEEATELAEAVESSAVLQEAADVLEVLTALAARHGFTMDDVGRAAEGKARDRGAFVDRVWLE